VTKSKDSSQNWEYGWHRSEKLNTPPGCD